MNASLTFDFRDYEDERAFKEYIYAPEMRSILIHILLSDELDECPDLLSYLRTYIVDRLPEELLP